MKANELRRKYLDFFKEKGHSEIPSASLVPENDPTTLFTGSGMQPMVPYLLGEEHASGNRITDSQKCFRSQDIEEVGDNRHTTFFEMLGNWSLGDYFKDEQIPWMFDFLIKEVGLDASRLYVTVFSGNSKIDRDEVSAGHWQNKFTEVGVDAKIVDDAESNGMQGGRIFYYDEKENWWSRTGMPENMPSGEPGGPDSEMFWDFGEHHGLHESSQWKGEHCQVTCECGRFIEIGNNVFMEYQKTDDGFESLPNKNVDFGGGLERILAAKLDAPDVFMTDLFDGAKKVIEQVSGRVYGDDIKDTYAFRVILDHVRAATFLIGDNVFPANKDQGYFVRRLLRRSVRFARQLGVRDSLLSAVAKTYIETYKEAYPELSEKILDEIEKEEIKFAKTLEKGLREFKKVWDKSGSISGKDAFDLYQTYGFPLELTEELAQEEGQDVDREMFKKEFQKHKDLSRAGAQQKFKGGLADDSAESTRLHTATHLLHQALRTVLGDHVAQRGSNITKERLRFDFSHDEKMTDEEKVEVERLVNEQIKAAYPVHFELLGVDEAKERGAIGLFEDKYAQMEGKVKVYFVGDYSKEICGGPHVENTSELGQFKIKKEQASSAGVRRIKAILGDPQ
ncbi:alanine--tRNA ligase [Candidatus Uhrbacteria bacterium]|jgi:alanyl-tRNA synthetase|nr:alanine--tRNA ligase [Candidatus Uhrbacteria bacterium]